MPLLSACSALSAFRSSAECGRLDPLGHARFSAWQRRFLADASKRRVLRAANQIGKTHVLCADLLHDLRGSNPYRPRRVAGPMLTLLVGKSIEQMSMAGNILDKLFGMINPGEVDPKIRYVRGEGIRGTKNPIIPFVSGPAAGSIITIKTQRQHPETFAGSTVHRVDGDEPMDAALYDELAPRLFHHDGAMTIGFTPTTNMPDQTWLRAQVDQGLWSHHHVEMTEENTWLEGFASPFYSTDRIEEMKRNCLGPLIPMRFSASWEPVYSDQYLTAWHEALVRTFTTRDIPLTAELLVGIDHGLVTAKQWAVLVACVGGQTDKPEYWIIDEAGGLDIATPDADAAAILDMLARNGLEYDNIDEWVGDRDTGDGRFMASKSNGDLRRAIARRLGREAAKTRFIHTPTKWDGSVQHGFALMNSAMNDRRLHVHSQAKNLAQACGRFRGGTHDKFKDVLDAARYACERANRTKPPDHATRQSVGFMPRRRR